MAGTGRRERARVLRTVDAVLFAFAGVSSCWLAYLLLREGFQASWRALLLLVFWLLVAYLVLPRLHRVLTYLYLPDYFIGRTRTSDGLLGDPVNLAFSGSVAQVEGAMRDAGWVRADEVTPRSGLRIVSTTLARRSYARAPVSPLHLFGRQQDFAYQQEVAGSPSKRHHVRFWRCPEGWLLPGGYAVDWLAAGTYDRGVGLSLWTFQVTHHIAEDTDTERDFIVESIKGSAQGVTVARIRDFSSGYHARNGGGDRIETDGDLPVVDVRAVPAVADVEPPVPEGARRRPAPTVFGALVAGVRALVYLGLALVLFLRPGSTDLVPSGSSTAATALGAALVVAALVDSALAVATYAGHNGARVLLMLASVLAIAQAFVRDLSGGLRPTLSSGLPAISLSILVLLALTSHRSRDYATLRRSRGQG